MRDILRSIIESTPSGVHLELRYHRRKRSDVRVDKGILRTADSDDFAGVGVRALVNGAWGFASTSKLDKATLKVMTSVRIILSKNE